MGASSQCRVTPYPSFDLVGTGSSVLAAASEAACAHLCCTNLACQGYAFGVHLAASPAGQLCSLVTNASQLVPSSTMNAGLVRYSGATS
jgi:hypothetical protein